MLAGYKHNRIYDETNADSIISIEESWKQMEVRHYSLLGSLRNINNVALIRLLKLWKQVVCNLEIAGLVNDGIALI